MVVANLDRKVHFSYKSYCHFCVPWLDQEPQAPFCESSPNKTGKDSRTWALRHVRVGCRVASSRDHSALLAARFASRRRVFGAVGEDTEEVKTNSVQLGSRFSHVVGGLVYFRNWTSGHPCLQFNHPSPRARHMKNTYA